MQINVAQLLKEPVGATRSYVIDELAGENDENHVKGEVNLIRTNRGVLVTGTLDTEIIGSCVRCLGEARMPVTFSIEEEYFPVVDINSGVQLQASPDEFTISENHILDLSEAIRQYIIMATPTKILCKPDCKGICPGCGKEIAGCNCDYSTKSSDHRWDKLVQKEKESKV
jgi:uncharacterized protein